MITFYCRALRACTLISIIVVLAACNGTDDGGLFDFIEAAPNPSPSDPEPATLEEVQSQVFSLSCAGSSCHDAVEPAAGLALDSTTNSYAALVNIASSNAAGFIRVIPNDPDSSYLVMKLEGTAGIVGEQMPRGGTPLSPDVIDVVRGWIASGAQPAGTPTNTPDPEPATLEEVQEQIFSVSCAGSSCHDADDPAAGIALNSTGNSYDALVNVIATGNGAFFRVSPNDPDNSYLIKKLENSADITGLQMPRGGAPLSTELINVVRGWIFAGAAPAENSTDPEPATLEDVQETVFSVSCAGSSCHDSDAPAAGLSLDSAANSYAGLVNIFSLVEATELLVDPGDPDNSYLIKKLEGSDISGAQMPRGGTPLSIELIDQVRGWIFAGAQPAEPSVSFSDIQNQVFNVSCAFVGCHDAGTSQGALALDSETTSFNELVNTPSIQSDLFLVNPGNPNDSYLIRKMEGGPDIAGQLMPPAGLDATLISLVRDWISEGALQTSSVTTNARVLKTTVEEGFDSLVYRLKLSAFVDQSSFDEESIQLYIIDGDGRHLASSEDIAVDISGAQLIVTYSGADMSFDSAELHVGDAGLTAMFDVYGAAIDGGVFHYPREPE